MDNSFSHKCPTCGAKIPFDPKSQLWVCDYCGGKFTASQISSFEENNKDTNNSKDTETNQDTHEFKFESATKKGQESSNSSGSTEDLNVYSCSSCGAQIVADQNTSATFCVYCGGYTLIKDRLKGEFKPDYIIPFHTTKDEAISEYNKKIKTKKFAPDKFKAGNNIDKITGVYIPFWTYDCNMRVQKSGTGEKHRTWSSGNYDYTEHKIYDFNRDMTASFDDVPVDGSKKFEDDLMDSIEPFDFEKKVSFDARYLSGFLAEKYDVDKDEAYKRAQLRMANTSNKEVDMTLGYSNIKINTNYISEQKGEVLYWLLPVWMLNTSYNGKTYQFAMNGVSKKVVGVFPTSTSKVLVYILKWFFIFAIIGYLFASVSLWNNQPGNRRYSFLESTAYAVEAVDYETSSTDILNFEELQDEPSNNEVPLNDSDILQLELPQNDVPLGEHGVPEAVTEKKVYDYADLLTDTQEAEIFRRIANFTDEFYLDMGVVTINENPKGSAMEFADDFYDYNNFGYDKSGSGLLLLLDMDTREIWISTKGQAILIYDDNRIENMLDAVYEFIESDNNRAVNEFIDLAFEYAKAGIPDSNSGYIIDSNGEYVLEKHPFTYYLNPTNGNHNIPTIGFFSLIISGIMALVAYNKEKDVKTATNATKYLKNVKWNTRDDTLIKQYTTSHYNPPTESSSGGSRSYHSGGGSSTHHSSSGSSHGGGGRHF